MRTAQLSLNNGSGKSTLLRLIAGRERADNGEMTVVAPGGVGYLAQTLLRGHRGTVVAIPHDRVFLEHITDTVLEVDGGKVTRYGDGYEGHLAARAAELDRSGSWWRATPVGLAGSRASCRSPPSAAVSSARAAAATVRRAVSVMQGADRGG